MFKLKGTVKAVFDTVQVSDKFSKREFVVTDSGSMYPQDIMFQLTKDNCSKIDFLQAGTEVEVSFNLRGREWINPQGEAKYFNTLEAWRVEVFDRGNKVDLPAAAPLPPINFGDAQEEESQDLPF